jgi:hypothetical protein
LIKNNSILCAIEFLDGLCQFGGKCRQLPQLTSGFDWLTRTVALTVIVRLIFGASEKLLLTDDFINRQFLCLPGISVKIQGKGEVMWTEQRSHSSDSNNTTMQNVASNIIQDPSTTDTYSSEESYFENKFNLLGGGNFI